MTEKDPTLKDDLNAINDLAGATATGFVDVQEKLNQHDQRFDQIDKKIESEIRSLKAEISLGLREIKEEIKRLDERIDKLSKTTVLDIDEIVEKVAICELDISKLKQKISKLKADNREEFSDSETNIH